MTRALLALSVALAACSNTSATTAPTDTGAAAPPPAPACEVQLSIQVQGAATATAKVSDPIELVATAKNQTSAPITLSLRDRCPSGLIAFEGLDAAFDYYETCTMGQCLPDQPPKTLDLAPGETKTLASVEVLTGPGGCNPPVAAGTYQLTFALDPSPGATLPTTCGPEPASLTLTE